MRTTRALWGAVGRRSGTRLLSSVPLSAEESLRQKWDTKDIRNFCIISHIDSGKTTLSAQLLQTPLSAIDSMEVEQQRGITVHASTASLLHCGRLLNLVDTPGHVDFSHEVSRAMAAVEGALFLVDATKGIQAQTLSNFWLAFERDLCLVPVINKVDLPHARPQQVKQQMQEVLEIDPRSVLEISAKSGLGCHAILPEVVRRVPPPPSAAPDAPLRMLLFDSWFDRHLGVVCLFRVFGGSVRAGDVVVSMRGGKPYTVQNAGILAPKMIKTGALSNGQVGWLTLGMKEAADALLGDTYHHMDRPVEALPSFKQPTPVVFAGLFPVLQEQGPAFDDAMRKILLTDSSLTVHKESSLALGTGFRVGFSGVLHMEVLCTRLEQEFGVDVIATAPTVPYEVETNKGELLIVDNPADFPEPGMYKSCREPYVEAVIVMPATYVGPVMELCHRKRATQSDMQYIGEDQVVVKYEMPLAETIVGFFDALKSITSGFASFEYHPMGYRQSNLVKVDILLNGDKVGPLATLINAEGAREYGKMVVEKLRKVMQRQLFEVVIQAAVGSNILCRSRVAALRKAVTAKCYGGDVTRKRKLLEKQKKGKAKMKQVGNVELSQEAFFSVLKD